MTFQKCALRGVHKLVKRQGFRSKIYVDVTAKLRFQLTVGTEHLHRRSTQSAVQFHCPARPKWYHRYWGHWRSRNERQHDLMLWPENAVLLQWIRLLWSPFACPSRPSSLAWRAAVLQLVFRGQRQKSHLPAFRCFSSSPSNPKSASQLGSGASSSDVRSGARLKSLAVSIKVMSRGYCSTSQPRA